MVVSIGCHYGRLLSSVDKQERGDGDEEGREDVSVVVGLSKMCVCKFRSQFV
jgi:hypothetical protein